MTQQRNSNGELRAAFTMREIARAKRSVPAGTAGIFLRVALAIVFMYLIFVSHLIFGSAGPVFISVLFLAAFFIPYLYRTALGLRDRRRAQRTSRRPAQNAPQQR
jgi:hypothetical protein